MDADWLTKKPELEEYLEAPFSGYAELEEDGNGNWVKCAEDSMQFKDCLEWWKVSIDFAFHSSLVS
jgi:hypothetical protein